MPNQGFRKTGAGPLGPARRGGLRARAAAGGTGIGRRALLRNASGVAIGAAALGALGGLGGALPVVAAASPITLVFQPWYNFNNATTPAGINLLHQGLEPWLAQNKGVNVQVVTLGYQGTMQAAILAGTGPDVFADWILPPYVEQGMVLDFQPYVQRDNVNLDIFPAGELAYFQHVASFGKAGALYSLPSYLHLEAPAVNLGMLDDLGLNYPEPDWTYEQWADLWKAASVKQGKNQRWGLAGFNWDGYDYYGSAPSAYYLVGFGGGYVNPNVPTQAYLNNPGTLNALNWMYDLMAADVVSSSGSLASSTAAVQYIDTAGGLIGIVSSWASLKWDLFAEPVYPINHTAYAASDFYAINSGTKQPELAWSLLKYLVIGQDWQRHMMKIALAGPNQKSLWEEYAQEMQSVAPPLRGKNLLVYNDMVQANGPTFGLAFRYDESDAAALIGKYSDQVQAKQMDWNEAGPLVSKQINAVELTGPAVAAQQAAALAALKQTPVSATSQYPGTPSTTGAGVPYSKTPYIIVSNGVYTMLGDGWDIYDATDNCTFACLPLTATEGEWVCRVVSVSNISCPQPSVWCKFGLMARGDLSDDAPYASVHVTGANQIEWAARLQATYTPGGSSGLVPAGTKNLMSPVTTKTSNYLIQPLWLKMTRQGLNWSAYASLNGTSWTSMGSPQVAEFGTGWIGIMSTAHNGDFNDKGYVRGVFDHLNFTPAQFLQIGKIGVPPSGGPVPSGWATMA